MSNRPRFRGRLLNLYAGFSRGSRKRRVLQWILLRPHTPFYVNKA